MSAAAAATRAAKPSFKYFSAWFCPYAHRATIALEHHSKHLTYEWIESLGWEKRPAHEDKSDTPHEWWYHWKSPELLKHNPSGLIPTLVERGTSRSVFESLVCVEYVDEAVKQSNPTEPVEPLLPEDPYERARCRLMADYVNKKVCSKYYDVLVRTDPEEQYFHFQELLKGLRQFSTELGQNVCYGGSGLSAADVALIPWAYRLYVFEHYRGPKYRVPEEKELEGYHAWHEHVMALPQVARTLPEKGRYLEHIGKYADSSARSKVANAVRSGRAAHEIDDERD
mmetsp:Transcript_6432/g.23860  ORF Transcript_6432/g.23860 Transcript_6432/m.23860 type:complete len:283 (-) Transcript_6432:2662-3510(-)